MVKSLLVSSRGNGAGTQGLTTAGATQFWWLGHASLPPSATETARESQWRTPGTISKLFVRVVANSTSTNSTVTVRKNTANTTLSVTIPAGQTGIFEDTNPAHNVSIASGDLTGYVSSSGGTGTFQMSMISVIFDPTNPNIAVTKLIPYPITINVASTSHSVPLTGYRSSGATTEGNMLTMVKVRGIAKNAYFRMGTNLRTTPTTFTLRKNAVDTAITITYAAGESGVKEDTTNQVQYEVGDQINWRITTGTGTENLTFLGGGIEYETAGQGMITAGSSGAASELTIDFGRTDYYPPAGAFMEETVEANAQLKTREPFNFFGLSVYAGANTCDGITTIRFRKNGAYANQSITIPALTTGWFYADATADICSDTDLVDIEVKTAGTLGLITIRNLAIWTSVTAETPGLRSNIGQFQKISSAVSNTQTIATTFKVKALIVYSVNASVQNTFLDEFKFSYGFSDGTNQRVIGIQQDDAAATSNANTSWASAIVNIIDGTAGTTAGATVSFGASDGFTLTWSPNDTTTPFIHYIAWGGSDITNVKVGVFDCPAATGQIDVTDPGFQPDMCFFLSPGRTTGVGIGAHASISMGWAHAHGQTQTWSSAVEDAVATMDSYRISNIDRVIQTIDPAHITGATLSAAEFIAWLRTGFRLNWTDVQSTSKNFYMAIQGGIWQAGSILGPAAGSPPVTVSATVGFQPDGIMLTGIGNETIQSADTPDSFFNICVGAASSPTNRSCVTLADVDAAADATCATHDDNDLVTRCYSPTATASGSTELQRGDLSAISATGFSLSYGLAGANNDRYSFWLAWKSESTAAHNVRAGQFQKDVVTTRHSISVRNLNFRPKALIIQGTQSANGAWNEFYTPNMGFSDGTNERSLSAIAMDNVATMDVAHCAADSVIAFIGNTTTITDQANVLFFADGFDVDWIVSGTSARIFQFIAIGGTDVTDVKVGQITHSNATGTVDYTDPGFQPDIVYLLPTRSNTLDALVAEGCFNAGAFNKNGEQFAIANALRDNTATATSDDLGSITSCLVNLAPATTDGGVATKDSEAAYSAMLPTGFRLNWTDAHPNATNLIFYLAIKGVTTKISTFVQPGSTAGNLVVTSPGFQPTGVMSFNAFQRDTGWISAVANSAIVEMGVCSDPTDTTQESFIEHYDINGATTSFTARYINTNQFLQAFTAGFATATSTTVGLQGNITSFNPTGFTVNYTLNTNAISYKFVYIAFGPVLLTPVLREILQRYALRQSVSNLRTQRYAVRQLVSNLRTQRYAIRQEVSQVRTQRYSLRQFVSQVRTQRYSIRQIVSQVRTQRYSIRQSVSRIWTQRYHLSTMVQRVFTERYAIRQFVTKAGTQRYSIRQFVSRDRIQRYAILQFVSRERIQRYTIRQSVSNPTTQRYSIRAFVSRVSTQRYHLATTISRVFTHRYSIRQFVSRVGTQRFSIRQFVSREGIQRYGIMQIVSRERTQRYSIMQLVSKQSQQRFAIRQFVSKVSTQRYHLATTIQNIHTQRYSIRQLVTRPSTQRYHITTPFSRVITQRYALRQTVFRERIQRYAILETVFRERIQRYSIRQIVSKDNVQRYTVRKLVSKETIQRYHITLTFARQLIQRYAIHAFVSHESVQRYHLATTISRLLTQRYALHQFITGVSTQRYSLREYITKQITQVYAIQAAISSISTQRYALHQTIQKQLTQRYAIRNFVSNISTQRYHLATSFERILSQRYAIHQLVSQEISQRYSIRKIVASITTQRYNLEGATYIITKQLTQIYSIRQLFVTEKTQRYSIRNLITKDSTQLYSIRQLVSSISSQVYAIRQTVSNVSSQFYNIRQIASNLTTQIYSIQGSVFVIVRQLSQRYSIRQTALRESTQRYSIRQIASLISTQIYSLQALVAKETKQIYSIRQYVVNESIQHYQIRRFVSNLTTQLWSIRQSITRQSSQRYSIHQIISRQFTQSYAIRTLVSSVSSQIYALRNIVSTVSTQIYATRQIVANQSTQIYKILIQLFAVANETIQSYAIRQITSNESSQVYSIRQFISKTFSQIYAIRISFSTQSIQRYAIRNMVSNLSTQIYSLQSLVTKETIQRYSIRQFLTRELTQRYRIAAEFYMVLREITQIYSIREFVSSVSSHKYKIISWMFGYKSKFTKYSRRLADVKTPWWRNWVKDRSR